jgi:hypothetical protein
VDRQLNRGGAPTPQLPNKKQRNGSSSSKKVVVDVQQLIDDKQPTTMLSTFGASKAAATNQQLQPEVLTPGPQGLLLSTKSTVVQLRRNTNRKGKQAPTPPKRTR